MKILRINFLILLIILSVVSCQNKKTEIPVVLEDIDLIRGDITLCGSQDFGETSFELSSNKDLKEKFDLALSLLHSFEYEEAEKAFVQVIELEPECVMAYWGIAMSNFHSLWLQSGNDYLIKGSKILEVARQLPKTEREGDYLDAISAFYDDWQNLDRNTRINRFEERMKAVYEKYDQDKEAAIFYALALRASADPADKSYKKQLESGKILESIYPNQPNHPGIAHYLIHNYDYPELAELALPTAREYARIAPSSAHAQHMPSHIFTRLGLWEESIQSNLNSTDAALCYSKNIDPDGHWDEELHGMDYLVYAYLQQGMTKDAEEQNNYLNTFKKVFPANFKVAYAAAAIPCRISLETKDWKKAATLQLPDIDINWNDYPWQKAIIYFSRALGAINTNNLDQAYIEMDTLIGLRDKLIQIQDVYKANQVQIQVKTIEAWIAMKENKESESIKLMTEAVEMEENTSKHPVTPGEVLPAEELLGDLYLEIGNHVEALKAYEIDLKSHPNRFNGIYGAAMAAKSSGNKEKANEYFSLLINIASASDRNELNKAKEYINNEL
ncbi:tetratricopeptide repeat protein [Marinigracilibium pacificum]|uniref:Tetratricopeptide repeat protein n=1 Tax=Marinigracilibium pacificum TaxID=2729599 RepID=A0A848JCR6_9BACT|nr:hypothetical protein [Marinigracilibium pacificum]NMM50792.1 hypothetical protein [Marinigracilibium pacificum]